MGNTISYKSKNEEINGTLSSILQTSKNHDFSNDIYLTELFTYLGSAYEEMTEALNEDRYAFSLKPYDDKRDDCGRVIFYEVKAKTLWPDEKTKTAAETVMQVLDKYGMDILNYPLKSESVYLKAMFKDFEKPEVSKAIDKLAGLRNLINNLIAAQEEFDIEQNNLLKKEVDLKETLTASKIAEQVREKLNKELVPYFIAMSNAKPEIYSPCKKEIDEIIKQNNQRVKTRLNNNKDTETD